MSDPVARLIDVLGVGRANAVHADVLQRLLGLPRQRTAESARSLVKAAIEEHGICIASDYTGYWLVETAEELAAYLRNLDDRIAGIQARRAALVEAWHTRNDTEIP